MTGDDILLARVPDFGALAKAIARAYGMSPSQVSVVGPDAVAATRRPILARVYPTSGEFKCMVDISVGEPLDGIDRIESASVICRTLRIRAFVADESLDPSSGYLITADGRVVSAELDDDAEERGEYTLRQS